MALATFFLTAPGPSATATSTAQPRSRGADLARPKRGGTSARQSSLKLSCAEKLALRKPTPAPKELLACRKALRARLAQLASDAGAAKQPDNSLAVANADAMAVVTKAPGSSAGSISGSGSSTPSAWSARTAKLSRSSPFAAPGVQQGLPSRSASASSGSRSAPTTTSKGGGSTSTSSSGMQQLKLKLKGVAKALADGLTAFASCVPVPVPACPPAGNLAARLH
jgi:hypothetical protein